MLTWRFIVQLNRSLVELVGLVIEKTEVVYLKWFPCVIIEKDISSHLRSCKFSDPENEVDLVLSRAGIFETPKDIDDFTNCPTHRSNLGVGWNRSSNSRCSVPKESLENSYNLASVSKLLTTVSKITREVRVKSRELVNRLPKIQTEAEFSEVMSEHFVGFPPSRGTRNYAHGGKGPFHISY